MTYQLWAISKCIRVFEVTAFSSRSLDSTLNKEINQTFEKFQQAIKAAPEHSSLVSYAVDSFDEIVLSFKEEEIETLRANFLTKIHRDVLKVPANSETFDDLVIWINLLRSGERYTEAIEIYEKYRNVDFKNASKKADVYTGIFEVYALARNDEAFYKYFEVALDKGYVDADYFSKVNIPEKYGNEERFKQLLEKYELGHLIAGKN